MERLSGTHVLYLFAEHAGIEARIEPPVDWGDPAVDMPSDEAAFDPSSDSDMRDQTLKVT